MSNKLHRKAGRTEFRLSATQTRFCIRVAARQVVSIRGEAGPAVKESQLKVDLTFFLNRQNAAVKCLFRSLAQQGISARLQTKTAINSL